MYDANLKVFKCDECRVIISEKEHNRNVGLCYECLDAIPWPEIDDDDYADALYYSRIAREDRSNKE